MRRVGFKKNILVESDGKKRAHWKAEYHTGVFHQWGNEYDEFENGIGNCTVAIIELGNGQIMTALPEDVRFLKGDE